MSRYPSKSYWIRCLCVVALLIQQTIAPAAAMGQENPVVAAGAATISQTGNSVAVTTHTERAIINWDSFSVPNGHSASFVQPSASSAVLNRVVTSGTPSLIDGSLTSNGHVYLVNPSGVA